MSDYCRVCWDEMMDVSIRLHRCDKRYTPPAAAAAAAAAAPHVGSHHQNLLFDMLHLYMHV